MTSHLYIMELNILIDLQPFAESDISELIAEIPDARFLLQWAGPKYTFPLDFEQLKHTLAQAAGEKPACRVFKAIIPASRASAGHVQLMDIDYSAARCVLGRVLLFRKYRGKGLGKAMVQAAVRFAFERLFLSEVTLGVFDFNIPAIHTYKSLGFFEYQVNKGVRQFQNERWTVIKMKLSKRGLFDAIT